MKCFTYHPQRLLLGLLAVILLACEQPSNEFFISPQGNDENSGTIDQPLATLAQALEVIQAQTPSPEEGFTIYLREGAYPLQESVLIGENLSTVLLSIRAYADEEVVIHGGRTLPAEQFEQVSAPAILQRLPAESRDHVQQIELSEIGVDNVDPIQQAGMGLPKVVPPPELFFNGEAMTLARWPNTGYTRVSSVVDPGSNPRSYQPDIPPSAPDYVPPEDRDDPWRGFTIGYDDPQLKRWASADDAWMFGYWYWDWADGIVRIAGVDTVKQQITSEHASWYSVREDQRFYVFNLLEELDQPGEWYLDRGTNILYFYPPASLADASIQISLLEEPLMVLNEAANVTIENITFEVARGHGVQVTGGENNLIAGCTFRRLSQKGVVIGQETAEDDLATEGGRNNGVVSCDIYDTGSGGILLQGGNRLTLEAGNNYAENNHIHHYSRIRKTYTEAIQIHGVGNRAAHNLIHDAPHAAILFRGNDHTIEYNEIHHVCQEADDAGAIYTGRDWTYRGNQLKYNFIHHVGGIEGQVGVFGIYLDDAMSSVVAHGNVFYSVWRAFHIGGGRDHRITNNLIIRGKESIRYDDRAYRRDPWFAGTMDEEHGTLYVRLRQVPYTEEPWASRYPQLVNILEGDPGIPSGSIIENNLIYDSPPMNLAEIVQQQSDIQNNLVVEPDDNSWFVNEDSLDFRFKENINVADSLAGFEDIPFAKIGLVKDEYRSELVSNDR